MMIRRRSPGQRLALTAGALACSVLLAACGSTADMVRIPKSTLPAMRSATAGALPRYGTCVIVVPVIEVSSSTARCVDEPTPAEP